MWVSIDPSILQVYSHRFSGQWSGFRISDSCRTYNIFLRVHLCRSAGDVEGLSAEKRTVASLEVLTDRSVHNIIISESGMKLDITIHAQRNIDQTHSPAQRDQYQM